MVGAPHPEWMPRSPSQAAIVRMFGVNAAGAELCTGRVLLR